MFFNLFVFTCSKFDKQKIRNMALAFLYRFINKFIYSSSSNQTVNVVINGNECSICLNAISNINIVNNLYRLKLTCSHETKFHPVCLWDLILHEVGPNDDNRQTVLLKKNNVPEILIIPFKCPICRSLSNFYLKIY